MTRLSNTEQAFLDQLVSGSQGRRGPLGQDGFGRCSIMFISADFKHGTTRDRDGAPGPFRRKWGRWSEVEKGHKPLRNLGTLSALQAIGARGWVHMDLQDARTLGRPAHPLPAPVLCYCRRPEAENIVLLPLPRYHDLGTQRFLGKTPPDTIAFDDKSDAVVWRGALSGNPRALPSGPRNTRQLLADLDAAKTPAEVASIVAYLRRNTRFGLVHRYAAHPDFDVGLTCDDTTTALFRRRKLGHVVKPRQPMSWQRQFRYILSIRGNDTGSNFIPALDSNSVVLREEDGWELFYSNAIRPWEHYIPLAPFLTDLDEKLDWARANPAECKAIVARAKEVCTLLGDARLRDLHLRAVYEHYRAITP
ncbi:hypothetical protein ROE7235_00745 [Roseibaca ekhonensis]|uniref:Glycosyl transferase CAP10 domain-containing protein n=1 Tax=Roseinatronobacter ekhonensis TaxID=254356 RepID=A0A3B0MQ29_9RHOB|nr:glycosyl transferase family 90 [Roseibaca ekhonensis]SUZ31014.1 hypothetical protein ROE7235_00745 [Roseibaca ekhonensis]